MYTPRAEWTYQVLSSLLSSRVFGRSALVKRPVATQMLATTLFVDFRSCSLGGKFPG